MVTIHTNYPATAEATIQVTGLPADIGVHVRIPSCVRGAELAETRAPGSARVTLRGRLGHEVEPCHGGVLLKYGPLVLAPSAYYWDAQREAPESSVPAGYIPPSLPAGVPALAVEGLADAQGFLNLANLPLPDWSYYDEGPGARLGVGSAAANVPLRFPGGERAELRFWPLCYNTSNLTYYETPIIFTGVTG